MRRFLVDVVYTSEQLVDVIAENEEDAKALALGRKRPGSVVSRTRYESGRRQAVRVTEPTLQYLAVHQLDGDGIPVRPVPTAATNGSGS